MVAIPSGSSNLSAEVTENSSNASRVSFSHSPSSSLSSLPVSSIRPPITMEFQSDSGWTFKSVRSSISSAVQVESLSHEIGFPLPTMFFGCNKVTIKGPNTHQNSGPFELRFDPIEAVKKVSKSAEDVPIKVSASNAEFWRQRSQSEIIFDYDWTFTPQSYTGTMNNTMIENDNHEQSLEINYERLKQQDPILFFDENILYEDELGDNGISIISVKLRVMDYGFYILLNHFLRVDGVIFKSIAVRYYHEFQNDSIIQEIRCCEDSFDSVSEKMTLTGCNFKDNEAAQHILPITSKMVNVIKLPN